jgi:hypothetical protein
VIGASPTRRSPSSTLIYTYSTAEHLRAVPGDRGVLAACTRRSTPALAARRGSRWRMSEASTRAPRQRAGIGERASGRVGGGGQTSGRAVAAVVRRPLRCGSDRFCRAARGSSRRRGRGCAAQAPAPRRFAARSATARRSAPGCGSRRRAARAGAVWTFRQAGRWSGRRRAAARSRSCPKT